LRVAFKIKNYIGKIPAARNIRHKDTYKETGIYQLAQITRKRYIGQTGKPFYTRLNEPFSLLEL